MPSPPDKDFESWSTFNPPIGLDQKRATATITELVMKTPFSFSGGDHEIQDSNGKTLFTCKGKFNLHAEKDLYDQHEDLLLHFDTSPKSVHRKTSVTDADGQEAFFVRKTKDDWPNLSVDFVDDASEKETELNFDGEWFKDKGLIKKDDLPVAQIYRESMWKLRWNIIVAPGVDLALAVGICIVFDMIQTENYTNMGTAVSMKKK